MTGDPRVNHCRDALCNHPLVPVIGCHRREAGGGWLLHLACGHAVKAREQALTGARRQCHGCPEGAPLGAHERARARAESRYEGRPRP